MIKNITICLAAIMFALLSASVTLGGVAKNKVPAIAIGLWPVNGFAFEKEALNSVKDRMAKASGQFPDAVSPATLSQAIQAFDREPTAVNAIAVLALHAPEKERAELMNKAFALSRREPLVTAWLIYHSARQENAAISLQYYDVLLRSSASSASIVLPPMAEALANEEFIAPMARLLEKNPPWAKSFWYQLLATKSALRNTAALRMSLDTSHINQDSFLDSELINTLISNNELSQASKFYSYLTKTGTNRDIVRDPNFDRTPKYPPFEWETFSTGEYGATISNGYLEVSATRSARGPFARQLIRLPLGKSEISVQFAEPLPTDSEFSLTLQCADTSAPQNTINRVLIEKQQTVAVIDNRESSCPFFWLVLSGAASESGNGFDAKVDYIHVTK